MNFKHLDIRFSFFCRTSSKTRSGNNPIVLRINYRKERKDIFTGLSCHANQWDAISQRVFGRDKLSTQINNNLEYLLHQCKEQFDALKYSGQQFTLDEVVLKLKGDEKTPTTIVEYLEAKVIELQERRGVDITKATVQKYSRCITHMRSYLSLKYKKKDVVIAAISSSMLMDFFYYLRTDMKNSHNTSLNYIKCLKTVLLPAIKNGLLNIDPFLEVKIAPKEVVRGFLTLDEIRRIEKLERLSVSLQQARDIFLFACYTGMAYIDIKQFSRQNIIKDPDGSLCINKPRQKTGQLSIIPLLPPAVRLLERYTLTGDILDFRWNVISNQKINDAIKVIGNKAEIKQEMYFHLARHTFATTITLSNGIPLETVSKMLGHTNIKMTQRYAKISGYKIKEDMRKLVGIFN